jgi:hypothetical protein
MISLWFATLLGLAAGLDGEAAAGRQVVRNGSFEVGLQNWGWYTRGEGGYPNDVIVTGLDPQPVRVAVPGAPHGRYVLRFDAPENCGFVGCTRAYEGPPGGYRLRLMIRCGMPVRVYVRDAGKMHDNVLGQTAVEPAAGWQSVEMAVTVPAGTSAVALSLAGSGPGRVELDQVELQAAEAAPARPVELGLEAAASGQVLFAGEAARILARAFCESAFSGALVYRVENAWGEEVTGGAVPMKGPAGQVTEAEIRLELPLTGHYRILAQVREGSTVLSETAELLLAVVPPRELPTSSRTAEASRFGCNMENRPWLMDLARRIGIRWVFCAPPLFTKWFSAEPRPGQWRFYDGEVARFEAAGLRLVGNLADPPFWATNPGDERDSGPWPNPNLPLDGSQWDEYVRQVASHYRPWITHWALWNEPNHPGYLKLEEGEQWVDRYRELLARTYRVLQSVDPSLQLVGGTVTNPGALPPLIRAGGLQYMDIAAFHWAAWCPDGYLRSTGEELGFLGPKEVWVNCLQWITEAFAEVGKRVPLWNTECHLTEADVEREFKTQPDPERLYGTPRMTPLDAANAIPRQYITEWAAGVEKTFYWLLATSESSWEPRTAKTLLEWDRSPTAALVAYAVMTDKLADAELLDWETRTDEHLVERPTIWIFRFRKPGGTLRVVWGNRDLESEITLPVHSNRVKVWDLFGVERRGTTSMSGVELRDRLVLRVARSPFYIFEPEATS